MKLTCTKDSRWQRKDGSILSVVKGQDVEVGVDVSDAIADDMLRCDYAIAKSGQPRVETKKEAAGDDKVVNTYTPMMEQEKKEIKVSIEDITSSMGKKDLEIYARKNLGIELDRRKGLKTLHIEVIKAIKEKNNE